MADSANGTADGNTLATISRVLFYVAWPFVKLAHAIKLLLSPFWSFAQFVLLPVTVLVKAILAILLLPFRLHLLERVETIYIYLGIASLIGFVTGAILYLSFNFISSTLRIDTAAEIESRQRAKGRTAAAYRAERKRKKAELAPTSTIMTGDATARRQRGILSQTIVEEEDSDF